MRRCVLITLAFLTSFASSRARASDPCVPEERFWSELRAREPDLAETATAGLRVTFTATTGVLIGELSFEERPSSVRSISGTRCEEVAGALALIAALAVESPVERPLSPIVYVPPPTAPPSVEQSRWSVGASALWVEGPVPSTAAAGPFGELAWPDFAFRVAVVLAGGTTQADPAGTGEFRFAALRSSGCTPSLELGVLYGRACGWADVGMILASGAGLAETRSAVRLYSAAGPSIRVGLAFRPIGFELEGSVGAPFLRDRFVWLGPSGGVGGTVHEVPAIVGSVALSAWLGFGD